MKPAKCCKCCNMDTLKLVLRSATMFISQSPHTAKLSDGSRSRSRRFRIRRCLARGATLGLTPPMSKRNRRNSDTESEPDSPRVSCVGQIEKRGKKNKEIKKRKKKTATIRDEEKHDGKKRVRRTRTTSELQQELENDAEGSSVGGETASYLNRTMRSSKGRAALCDFDWKLVGNLEER